MRRPRHLPSTSVSALQREVLAHGAQGALPQNLSDRWLRLLVRDMMVAADMADESAAKNSCSGVLLLVNVLAIAEQGLAGKNFPTVAPPATSEERVVECFTLYRVALLEELVARQIGVFTRDYSVADIFT